MESFNLPRLVEISALQSNPWHRPEGFGARCFELLRGRHSPQRPGTEADEPCELRRVKKKIINRKTCTSIEPKQFQRISFISLRSRKETSEKLEAHLSRVHSHSRPVQVSVWRIARVALAQGWQRRHLTAQFSGRHWHLEPPEGFL